MEILSNANGSPDKLSKLVKKSQINLADAWVEILFAAEFMEKARLDLGLPEDFK